MVSLTVTKQGNGQRGTLRHTPLRYDFGAVEWEWVTTCGPFKNERSTLKYMILGLGCAGKITTNDTACIHRSTQKG